MCENVHDISLLSRSSQIKQNELNSKQFCTIGILKNHSRVVRIAAIGRCNEMNSFPFFCNLIQLILSGACPIAFSGGINVKAEMTKCGKPRKANSSRSNDPVC